MLCIHGLDNNNCDGSAWGTSQSNYPPIVKNSGKIENLRPENPFFKKHMENKKQSEEYLTPKNTLLSPNLINPLPVPNLINSIPNFENKDFMKKLDALNLEGLDPHGISKKIKLESPTVKLDEE